jgi:hypothetical protein
VGKGLGFFEQTEEFGGLGAHKHAVSIVVHVEAGTATTYLWPIENVKGFELGEFGEGILFLYQF